MGEVYLAQDTKLDRKVALKILPADVATHRDRMSRFVQEAKAASALNHPNIITIHEIEQIDSVNFIATEFIDGETLRERTRKAPLKLREVLDVAVQSASALSAAHAAGIVHRDIKPENIMVRRDGIVKVLDFGLAKLTAHESTNIDTEALTTAFMTDPGSVVGTAIYMSPEQARGLDVDARTDIWSLGVVLYEMVAGSTPFAGSTSSEVLASILSEKEPQPLARYSREVPAELERIASKALRKNRDERYQTTKDLLLDLKSLKQRLEFEAEVERTSSARQQSESATKVLRSEPEHSIAVLPFANTSADPENEYFCDGLAEELLNALAKIDELKVAARTSSFSFKGKNINVSEIGRTLGVRTVLEGSVRKSGNRTRITAQLVNAADGYHLWSERYDREMQDIFDVQDEITLSVVDALKLKLFGEAKAAVLKRHTDNAEAYQLYLKGRYHWYKATPEGCRQSRDYFERAIDLDPTYALGYAGLSEYYGFCAAMGMMPANEGWVKAEAAMAKAQELDDTLPEVHNGLAAIKMFYYRDWREAERELKRAIELNPKFAEVHLLYSFCLVMIGQVDEAVAESKRALELDPLSTRYSYYLGNWFYYARQHDEAIRQYHQTLELDPNNPLVHEAVGDACERKEMYGEAVAGWQRAMTLAGDNELAAILSGAYAEADFGGAVRAVAQKRLERLNERVERGEYVPAISFARAYVILGDTEQAFHWLEKACEERNVFALLMNSDPFYDSLRGKPRFQDLVRRVGLNPPAPTDGR